MTVIRLIPATYSDSLYLSPPPTIGGKAIGKTWERNNHGICLFITEQTYAETQRGKEKKQPPLDMSGGCYYKDV